MAHVTGFILSVLWLAWLAYWVVSAGAVKPTVRAGSWQSRLAYSLPLWIAAILLLSPAARPLDGRFYPPSDWIAGAGLAMTAAGLAFAIWARRVLGENWSGQVTVKAGHVLMRSGPYAVVRHPIYTGGSLALLGTAIAIGEWRGLVAWALATASFWYKLRIEERLMTETFGEAYVAYAREVAALVPFVL